MFLKRERKRNLETSLKTKHVVPKGQSHRRAKIMSEKQKLYGIINFFFVLKVSHMFHSSPDLLFFIFLTSAYCHFLKLAFFLAPKYNHFLPDRSSSIASLYSVSEHLLQFFFKFFIFFKF